MSEGKNILINVFSSFIYWIIFSIGATRLTPIFSGILLFLKGDGKEIHLWTWCILAVSIMINIISIIINILVFMKKGNKPQFPIIKTDMIYEKLRTELYFENRRDIKCFREVRFKVLCEKMEHIRKQFTWTGDGYIGTFMEPNFEDKYLIDSGSIRKCPPQIYDVIFKEPKKKGDYVHYRVRTEVFDEGEVMLPFLSQHISGPAKKMELVVSVPKGMIKNVRFVEYADSAGKMVIGEPIPVESKSVGNLDVYEFEKKKPELLHKYKLEWEFDK